MQYFDKNGKEIKAGMKILMEDGKELFALIPKANM